MGGLFHWWNAQVVYQKDKWLDCFIGVTNEMQVHSKEDEWDCFIRVTNETHSCSDRKENEWEHFIRVTNETRSWSDRKEDERIGCENNQQRDSGHHVQLTYITTCTKRYLSCMTMYVVVCTQQQLSALACSRSYSSTIITNILSWLPRFKIVLILQCQPSPTLKYFKLVTLVEKFVFSQLNILSWLSWFKFSQLFKLVTLV